MFLGSLFLEKKKKERPKFLPLSLESCYYETESTAAICKSSTWHGVRGSKAVCDTADFKGHGKLSLGFWSSAEVQITSSPSCFITNLRDQLGETRVRPQCRFVMLWLPAYSALALSVYLQIQSDASSCFSQPKGRIFHSILSFRSLQKDKCSISSVAGDTLMNAE